MLRDALRCFSYYHFHAVRHYAEQPLILPLVATLYDAEMLRRGGAPGIRSLLIAI